MLILTEMLDVGGQLLVVVVVGTIEVLGTSTSSLALPPDSLQIGSKFIKTCMFEEEP